MSEEAPANVRVLVRVRPLSDAEKSHGRSGASILTLGGAGSGGIAAAAAAPMDFGQAAAGGGSSGGTAADASAGSSATVTVNEGGLGGPGAGGGAGGYGSGYESGGGGGNATAPNKTYQFDAVLGPRSTQADVFSSVRGIVDAVAAGYNGTIVAYGQTGSGKSFTVFGGSSGSGSGGGGENAGLVQRSLQALFRSIALSQAEGAAGGSSSTTGSTGPDDVIRETTTRASFFEIFNERVYDLLSEEGALETALNVREDAARGVYVDGLQEFEVKDLEDAEAVIAQGAANRQVASTSMNRASSRSHAVFVLTVRSVFTNADGLSKVRTSRFTLVDLAGSERQRSTNATGDRLKEASSINSSLLTLGNVINALADRENGRDSRHIPFRDSKLTFLLRDSWGGNSKTCLVATVSPAASSASETVSTLKFAQRAKQIKNQAVRNEDTCGTVAALRAEVARLRSQLDTATNTGSAAVEPSSCTLRGRPPLPSASASSAATGGGESTTDSSDAVLLAVVERRALRAEGRVSTLESQLDKKHDIVKSLKRKLQEEQMVQKFKQRRIDCLSSKSAAARDEMSNVVDASSGSNQEVSALLGEIDALRKMLDRPSPDLVEMKVEYERVKEQLEEKNSAVGPSKFAEIELESLEGLVKRLTDEKRDLEKRLSSIDQEQSNTQKEVEEILEEVSKLESEMAQQKQLLGKREEELWLATENSATSEAKSDELQVELGKVREELSEATAKIESIEGDKNAASQELESLREKITELQSKLDEKESALSALEVSHATTEEELQSRISALSKSLAESSDSNASSSMELREKLAAASKDNTVLVQRVTEVSSEVEKQRSLLAESEKRVQKLQDEKESAVKDAEQGLLNTASLRSELADCRSSLDKMASDSSAALETERANNLSKVAQLEEIIESLQKEKESILEEADSKASDRIKSLEEEKEGLKASLQAKDNEIIEAKSTADGETEESAKIIANLETKLKTLEEETTALASNSSLWQKRAEDSQETVGELKAQLKHAKKDKGTLEFQLESLFEDQDVLNHTVRSLQDRNDELEERLGQLLAPSASVQAMLAERSTCNGTGSAGDAVVDDSVLQVTKGDVEHSPTVERQSEDDTGGGGGAVDDDAGDFEEEDSFDEDMFLPNAAGPTPSSSTADDEDGVEDGAPYPPSCNMANPAVAIGGKENPPEATTPFRKSAKKRPLSSLKTPADGSVVKKLNVKTPTSTAGSVVKRWPTVPKSETKVRTGWSAAKK